MARTAQCQRAVPHPVKQPFSKFIPSILYFQITSKIFTEVSFLPVRPIALTGFLTDFKFKVVE